MAKTKDIREEKPQITGLEFSTLDQEKASRKEGPDPSPPPRKTKVTMLRDMLGDPSGASLQTLMLATGWQSHTVRAALSGLRKTGLNVTRTSDESGPIYTATPANGRPNKAAETRIARTRPRKTTVQEAGDPKTPPFAAASIASGVEDAAAPVSTVASIFGTHAASDTPDEVAS